MSQLASRSRPLMPPHTAGTRRHSFQVKPLAAATAGGAMKDASLQAMKQLEASAPAYATVRQTQALIVESVREQLALAPAQRPGLGEGGLLTVEAPDGSAAAAVHTLTGQGVRWLSASQLANPVKGFGGSIITGFTDATSDVPHYLLEQTLFGGEVLLVVALWPRRDWMVEDAYLQHFYGSAPPGCQRSYNELYNSTLQQAGWRRYQSPEVVVKPMLSTAMAYTFEPTEDNLVAARAVATEVAQLWAAFLKQALASGNGARQAVADEVVKRYDIRYVDSVKEDPGNVFAARMFGQEATDRLVATMHGWQEDGA